LRRSALLLVLVPAVALAAEHHAAPHGIPWGKLLFSTVNLAIFIAILRSFAWPGIREALSSRRAEVVDLLEKAAKAMAESEQLQRESQQRLANLDVELQEMRRQTQADIAAERERILEATRKVAETIRRDAQRAAEQEVRNAEGLLRGEVAAQALAIAERLAKQRIGANEQRRFVSEFLEQVRP
jgi:F-type H+-transporting ATPase subunit b